MQGLQAIIRYLHGQLMTGHTIGGKSAHNSYHNPLVHRRSQFHEASNYIDQHYQVLYPRMNVPAI